MEEMKNLVIQSLETRGVLGQIRAKLRSAVFKIVDEQDQKYNMGCGLKWENPTLYKISDTKIGTLIAEITREFLEYFRMDYSLSIFIPECSISPERLKKEELLAKLGLLSAGNTANNFNFDMTILSQLQLPLIYYIIHFFLESLITNPEKVYSSIKNARMELEKQSDEIIDANLRDYFTNYQSNVGVNSNQDGGVHSDENLPVGELEEAGNSNSNINSNNANQNNKANPVNNKKAQKENVSTNQNSNAGGFERLNEIDMKPGKRSYEYEDNRRVGSGLSLETSPKRDTRNTNVNMNMDNKNDIQEQKLTGGSNNNQNTNNPAQNNSINEEVIDEEIVIDDSYEKSLDKRASSGNAHTISQSAGFDGTVDSHALEKYNYIEPVDNSNK